MNFLSKVGLGLFLIVSTLIVVVYSLALYEKVVRPNFKNLNDWQFFWAGVVVVVLVVIDVSIVRRFVRAIRRHNGPK